MTDPVAALAERLRQANSRIGGYEPEPWKVLAREALVFARAQLPSQAEVMEHLPVTVGPGNVADVTFAMKCAEALLRDLRARLGGE